MFVHRFFNRYQKTKNLIVAKNAAYYMDYGFAEFSVWILDFARIHGFGHTYIYIYIYIYICIVIAMQIKLLHAYCTC